MRPPPLSPPRPGPHLPPPLPAAAKIVPKPETLEEKLDDLRGLVQHAIAVGAVTQHIAEEARAEAHSARAKVDDLSRSALGDDGRPGVVYWMANEIAAMRRERAAPSTWRMPAMVAAAVSVAIVTVAHFAGAW